MAQWLKLSTAVTVKVGPFLDSTDGNTVEGGLTITQADVRLAKNGTNIAQKNESTALTHDELGWYDCLLDATDTGTLGLLKVIVHESGALQVWHEFIVLPANIYDSLVSGSDALEVDVIEWLGTAAATPTVAGVPEVDLTHLGGVAQSATDLKDFADEGYDPATNKVQGVVLVDTVTTLTGHTPQTADGPTAAENADAVWDEILTGATHNIATSAGRRLRAIQEFQGYEDGAIWIDTINGVAGTVDFENGTVENPVDTIADANTLAASLGISRFRIAPGSVLTFAASQQNQEFLGSLWTLALGGQDLTGSIIHRAMVSGIATNTDTMRFVNCSIETTTTLDAATLLNCALNGSIVLAEAGDYFFDNCYSGIAGTVTPDIDFGASLTQNLSIRHYSGGIEIKQMGVGVIDTMSLEGYGQLVLNANCTGGTIAIRGHFTVTDNAGGAITLSDDARYDVDQINAQVDTALADYGGPTNAEMVARTLLAASYGTLAGQAAIETDTQDMQTRLPAALIGGRMNSDMEAINNNTLAAIRLALSAGTIVIGAAIAGTLSTTQMTTDLTEATTDHYEGRNVMWTSGVLNGQFSNVTAYDGVTKMLTFTAITEPPGIGDSFILV